MKTLHFLLFSLLAVCVFADRSVTKIDNVNHRLTESLTVPSGRTLRIESGATLDATGATLVGVSSGSGTADGTFLYGSSAPGSGVGANGDLYIDTVAATLYKKSAGAWSAAFATLSLSSHGHAISGITGLQAALDGKQSLAAQNNNVYRDAALVTDIGTSGGSMTLEWGKSYKITLSSNLNITGFTGTKMVGSSTKIDIATNGTFTVTFPASTRVGTDQTPVTVLTPALGFHYFVWEAPDAGSTLRLVDSVATAGGSGTVTSFSAGDLSPLFTTSEATVTSTPALTFSLTNAAQNAVLAGPSTGGTGAPTYRALVSADIPSLAVSNLGAAAVVTSAEVFASNDNDTSFPTTAAVIDAIAAGGGGGGGSSAWGTTTGEVDVASASTTDLGAATDNAVRVTGTTTITSFGTVAEGTAKLVRFASALTLTHNATSLILPGGANITTAAGDSLTAYSLGGGNWKVAQYSRQDGTPLAVGANLNYGNDPGQLVAADSTFTAASYSTTQRIKYRQNGQEVFAYYTTRNGSGVATDSGIEVNGFPLLASSVSKGTGTAYTVTATSAKVDMGTTDPAHTLTLPGTYRLTGSVTFLASAATIAAQDLEVTVYRTNNTGATITTELFPIVAQTTQDKSFQVSFIGSDYSTVNSNDALEIRARLVTSAPSAGTLAVTSATLATLRLK